MHHAFFVHFFAVTARLRRESAQFHDLWRAKAQDNDFLILFLNLDTVSEFNSKKIANIWRTERDGIGTIKFEAARIHFLSDIS